MRWMSPSPGTPFGASLNSRKVTTELGLPSSSPKYVWYRNVVSKLSVFLTNRRPITRHQKSTLVTTSRVMPVKWCGPFSGCFKPISSSCVREEFAHSITYRRVALTAPRTVAGQVAEHLKAEILAGERAAGTRLPQVEIARRLGVSTTPVREALAALQREGLVRLHPQRGAVVFLPSVDDLREHYEIRAALEALAAAKAAERFRADWAAPLVECLDEMRDGPPAGAYIALNQRFHTELYAHAQRLQLVAM